MINELFPEHLTGCRNVYKGSLWCSFESAKAAEMREVVKLDTVRMEHLERLLTELELGDAVRLFLGRWYPSVQEFPEASSIQRTWNLLSPTLNRVIVAREHLPDELQERPQYPRIPRGQPLYAMRPGDAIVGILSEIEVDRRHEPSRALFDPDERRVYTCKPTAWLTVSSLTPFDRNPDYSRSRGKLFIDARCLGAYEVVASRALWPLNEVARDQIRSGGKRETTCAPFEETLTVEQQLELDGLAMHKTAEFWHAYRSSVSHDGGYSPDVRLIMEG